MRKTLTGLMLSLCFSNSALACLSNKPQPLAQRYDEAAAVFFAEIEELDCPDVGNGYLGPKFPIKIRLTVTNVLKGNPEVSVKANGEGYACSLTSFPVVNLLCDFKYRTGRKFLIFMPNDREPRIAYCSHDFIDAEYVSEIELENIMSVARPLKPSPQ